MVRLLFVCLVGLGLASGNNGAGIPRKISAQLNTWHLYERCFGETNLLSFSLGLHTATQHCKAKAPGQHGLQFPQNANNFFLGKFSRDHAKFHQSKSQDDTALILKGLINLLKRDKRQADEEVPEIQSGNEEVIKETDANVEENEAAAVGIKDSTEDIKITDEATEEAVQENKNTGEETKVTTGETKDTVEESHNTGEDEVKIPLEVTQDSVEESEEAVKEEVEDAAEETVATVEASEDDAQDEAEVDASDTEAENEGVTNEENKSEDDSAENSAEDDFSIEFDDGTDARRDSDLGDFVENLQSWQSHLSLKMSNLTCVLSQLGLLDASGQPDLARLAALVSADMATPGSAIADPEFRQMMTDSYKDCRAIADAWPQDALRRNWLTEDHGKNVVFFTCVKKAQVGNCGKWDALAALEVWYGKATEEDRAKLTSIGLPKNKFDAAVVSMRILYDAVTPEEEFVRDFFWGKY